MKKKKPKIKPSSSSNSSSDGSISLNSKIKSGLAYAYILAFFVLLSGFFYPIVTDTDFSPVIKGTFVLLLGLAGGILLYKATVTEGTKIVFLGMGLGMIAISLGLIFVLTGRV